MNKKLIWLVAVATLGSAQAPDLDVFAKIRAEATEHSQAEPVFDMFTIGIGPRLTASPAHKRAAEYARARLAGYGLSNARLEPWHFGRGWTLEKLTIEMVEPRYLPLIGYADGWSSSTNGEIVAAPVWIGGKSPEQVADLRSELKGAIVMTEPMMTDFVRKDRPQPSDPNYAPMSAAYATSVGRRPGGRGNGPTPAQRIAASLKDAGAGVILKPSRGEFGTVFVTGRDGGAGAVPTVTLSAEQYNMIAHMLEQNIPVKLRVNVQGRYYDADNGNAYNVLAELPGSDPAVRDEVVMIGGHLDSWHTGVGATDNADGATTVMEAMRILKAIGARPRRTIRVALWGGEEQGLLGSRAWVAQHLTGANAAAARIRCVFQHRQRHGSDIRVVSAEYGSGEAVVRRLAGAAQEVRSEAEHDRAGGVDGPHEFYRRGGSGVQSDPGLRQLRYAHASHEHGYGGSGGREGNPAGSGGDGVVRVQRGDGRREDRTAGGEIGGYT